MNRSSRSVVWMAAVIVGATCLAYSATLSVPLLLDDESAIIDNPSIRDLRDLTRVLSPRFDSTTGGRPLLNLTFAINHAISGVEPWSYHVINLVIHVLGALVLFGVVRRTLLSPLLRARWERSSVWFAGLVALLWAVHPVQTQSVTYISQRAESMMGLFYLATIYCFIRGVEGRSWLWHPLAVAACLLGALTKEVIVTAPLMVLLYDRTFVTGTFAGALRRRRLFYAALGMTWIVLGWLMLDVRQRGVGFSHGISAFHYALTQCDAVCIYLRLCLWPHPLIFDRGTALITSAREVLPQGILLAGCLATAIWAVLRRPALGFVLLWFFILLAPTSSIVPVAGAPVAENRVYLPLAAVAVLVVLAFHACLASRLVRGLGGALVLTAIILTGLRNQDYASALGIWSDTVHKAPLSARAHNNLALLLTEIHGRQREALEHYLKALRLQPDYAEAHNNFAFLLAAMPDHHGEAYGHYMEALRLKPDSIKVLNNLADFVFSLPDRKTEALNLYAESLRLKPNQPKVLNNLGNLLAKAPDRVAEAVASYTEALHLKPDYAEAHNNLANLLFMSPGRQEEALAHYIEALRLNPNYAEAHCNLGARLAGIPGRQEEALDHYIKALRLKPDYTEAHFNLGLLLSTMPERKLEALNHYKEAARLLPNHPVLQFNYARQLETTGGDKSEVAVLYARVLDLDPNFAAARDALERLRQ